MDGLHIQVDAAPEFRLQCLRENIRQLDVFILTHGHTDHITGMDDLRRFCDLLGGEGLPVYSTDDGISRVLAMYPYAIMERPVVKGYPAFKLKELPPLLELLTARFNRPCCPTAESTPSASSSPNAAPAKNSSTDTDCKRVPREAVEIARGADLVVLDGLRPLPHPSHLSIPEAVDVAREIAAPRTMLTHLTHLSDHAELAAELPAGIEPAHDGLRVRL